MRSKRAAATRPKSVSALVGTASSAISLFNDIEGARTVIFKGGGWSTVGRRVGQLPAKSITPAAVDKLYVKLRGGEDGTKYRSANLTIDIAKKAWRVVQRSYPDLFYATNPFEGLDRIHNTSEVAPASRAEAYALAVALKDLSHPHLGAAP